MELLGAYMELLGEHTWNHWGSIHGTTGGAHMEAQVAYMEP